MITLNRPSILLLIPLLSLSTVSTFAAPAQQEQLDQSRAQEAERQEHRNQERAEVVAPPPPSSNLPADESVRFHISHVTVEHQSERFRFLERLSRPYEGKELSLREINDLVTTMNRALMSRGFRQAALPFPNRISPPASCALSSSWGIFMPSVLQTAVIWSTGRISSPSAQEMF